MANFGPKVVFWSFLAKFWSSWTIWHHARPRERNFGGFLDDEVLKLFLETVIIAILGQQAADFAWKLLFLVFLDHCWPWWLICCHVCHKNKQEYSALVVFYYWSTDLLLISRRNFICLPKMPIYAHFGKMFTESPFLINHVGKFFKACRFPHTIRHLLKW